MTLEERLWKTFNKALGLYQLIDEDDKILVGLSGGKDSLCLLEFLARRSKVHVPHFTVHALHVRMENIQYETDTTYLQSFCDNLGVPLHIVTTSFNSQPSTLHSTQKRKPACFLCSWQRRKQLFNLAQELGCNKIALGHHQDDIIHTALMNLTFQGQFSTMPACLEMEKMPLTIIRPLCLCEEADIKEYAEQQHYEKQLKQCPYEHDTQRTMVQELFDRMQQMNKEARYSIWNALEKSQKLIQRASLLLLLLLVSVAVPAQRKKQVRQKIEQPSAYSERLQRMTMSTQHIMFIDSVVLRKEEFLKAYHLSSETGRIAPYSTFFPQKESQTMTYMNALNNRCLYAENDSCIYSQELLQQQWSVPDTLAGINTDRQLRHICYPFIMPDGMTLYFAAEGEESIGGYDLFMTTYDAAEGHFLKPENIGMPFNSTANDYLYVIDEYNHLGFFASDRNQPDSMVCVYTFIPAEKYQPYDATKYTPEQIMAFAQIADIKMTQDDQQQYNAAQKRLRQAKKQPAQKSYEFSFVVNDQLTYHYLKDFKADGNQKRYQQLIQSQQRYDKIVQALDKARMYFPKATANERQALSREILDNEKLQYELHLSIRQQEKNIRNAEIIYLTRNK